MAHKADTAEDTPEFVTRKQAAEMLSITVSGVRRYERQHKLTKIIEDGGEVVYRVGEIDAILDGRLEPGEAERRHLESLYKSRMGVVDDMKAVIEQHRLLEESQRLELVRSTSRITELESRVAEDAKTRAELLQAFETMTTAAHERSLELSEFERSQARKDKAFDELKPLARAVAIKFGLAPDIKSGESDLVDALVEFKKSVRPEQMASLAKVLTTEQAATLYAILDVLPGNATRCSVAPLTPFARPLRATALPYRTGPHRGA